MKELCSQVGRVTKFNIVYDKETGKSKGFGFCEYYEAKLVDASVDCLNGYEHRGRPLFVRRGSQQKHLILNNNNNQSQSNSHNKKAMDVYNNPKKKTTPNPPKQTISEIQRVVAALSNVEKKQILNDMKQLIAQNEERAKHILAANPQLVQALFFIQLDFRMISMADIDHFTVNVSNNNQQKDAGYKVNEESIDRLSNEQQNILQKVLKMSAEQIDALPSEARQKILALKNQMPTQSKQINISK